MESRLFTLWHGLQRQLFPLLEEELGVLSATDERFASILALLAERFDLLLLPYADQGRGRRRDPRGPLARAFIAKSAYQFPTTAALIEALRTRPNLRRLCGYDSPGEVPAEWTCSRAFAEFAAGELPTALHQALIAEYAQPRLVGHISRDSTAIEARARVSCPVPAAAPVTPAAPRKRGRPRKGELRPPPPPPRLQWQAQRPVAENLAELPRHCAWGCKTNSQGKTAFWKGYKLHLDVADGEIPISAVLTAANLPDSPVAIPLAQLTAARVASLYDLLDAAYDAEAITQFSRGLGHVPIVDSNPQRKAALPLAPAAAARYRERTTVERVNSLLKDKYGGRWVRVRGAAKVLCHLMFALVALTAERLFALVI
jgi:hypothetical protein